MSKICKDVRSYATTLPSMGTKIENFRILIPANTFRIKNRPVGVGLLGRIQIQILNTDGL